MVVSGAVEISEARGAEGGDERTICGGDELVSGASRCSSGEAVVKKG